MRRAATGHHPTTKITPKVRCAIYTRKSSEEGLDMEFNSLDAQREACAAYILSQDQTLHDESFDSFDFFFVSPLRV